MGSNPIGTTIKMHTHYRAVCDKHKTTINLIVNKNWITYLGFYDDYAKEISAFLTSHIGCDLRLTHSDKDLDFLFDNNYTFVDNTWVTNDKFRLKPTCNKIVDVPQ